MADTKQRTDPSSPVRLGVIGAGAMASRVHLPILAGLAKAGAVSLVEICDLNYALADAARTTHGFERASHDAAALIRADDIDAVYIFGTAQMHHEYGSDVLRAGKHLFVEKPPAPGSSQLAELIGLADEHGRIAVAGFNRRFAHPVGSIMALARKEPLRSLEGTFHTASAAVPVPFGARSWLMANAIHTVDLLCFVAGAPPAKLYTALTPGPSGEPRDVSAVLVWENGMHATFASNNSTGSRREAYTFHSYGSSVTWEGETVTVSVNGRDDTSETYAKDAHGRGFVGEHEAFVDAVRTGQPPVHALATARTSLRVMELIEEGFCGLIPWDEDTPAGEAVERVERAAPERAALMLAPRAFHGQLGHLAGSFTLVYPDELSGLSQQEREEIVALFSGPGGAPVTAELLDQLPRLRVAGIVGASVKKYSPELLLDRKVAIINTSDTYASAVAEFVIMQAVLGLRRASRSHEVMRRGGWGTVRRSVREQLVARARALLASEPLCRIKPVLRPLWHRLAQPGSTGAVRASGAKAFSRASIGLIGYGSISRQVALLARSFGCQVRIHSDHLSDEDARSLDVLKSSLAEVLDCDVVSLHRGLSPATVGSFGRNELARLKPGTVLINTSRGAVVDEDALYERLAAGDVFACLDVFEQEPLPARHRLRTLPNIFLTSHLAGAATGMTEDAAGSLVDKIDRYLAGEMVEGVITTRARLATMT